MRFFRLLSPIPFPCLVVSFLDRGRFRVWALLLISHLSLPLVFSMVLDVGCKLQVSPLTLSSRTPVIPDVEAGWLASRQRVRGRYKSSILILRVTWVRIYSLSFFLSFFFFLSHSHCAPCMV